MHKVREIMMEETYCCHEDSSIIDVLRCLYDNGISGVPLVDDEMHVVGFISDGDIMKHISRKKPRVFGGLDASIAIYDDTEYEEKLEELNEMDAMELATTRIVSVDADDDVDIAAQLLARKHIKKIPVIENGVMVGIVSRSIIIHQIIKELIESYEDEME